MPIGEIKRYIVIHLDLTPKKQNYKYISREK